MLKHLSHREIACLESGSSPKSKPKNSEQVPFKKKYCFESLIIEARDGNKVLLPVCHITLSASNLAPDPSSKLG